MADSITPSCFKMAKEDFRKLVDREIARFCCIDKSNLEEVFNEIHRGFAEKQLRSVTLVEEIEALLHDSIESDSVCDTDSTGGLSPARDSPQTDSPDQIDAEQEESDVDMRTDQSDSSDEDEWPDWEEALVALNRYDESKFLHEFTRDPNPTIKACYRVTSYFNLLLDNVKWSLHPKPIDYINAKLAFNNSPWWLSSHLPDWNAITNRDFNPLWDLLLARKPPSAEALHAVEASILG